MLLAPAEAVKNLFDEMLAIDVLDGADARDKPVEVAGAGGAKFVGGIE